MRGKGEGVGKGWAEHPQGMAGINKVIYKTATSNSQKRHKVEHNMPITSQRSAKSTWKIPDYHHEFQSHLAGLKVSVCTKFRDAIFLEFWWKLGYLPFDTQ